jgi:uncharacterized protein YqhQ
MALPDGVFIKSARAWAVARADGSVQTGANKVSPVAKVPLVRVLYQLVQGFAAIVKRRGGSGLRTRRDNVRLLVALGSTFLVGWALDRVWPGAPDWAAAYILTIATLVVVRVLMPAAMWRYHGAEHKAITAFERYGRPATAAEAMPLTRIHDRCGTNAVFLAFAVAPFVTRNFLLIPAVLVAAELLRFMVVKHQYSPATRILVAGGRFLQRTLTTVEPTIDEMAVGCRAVEACVAKHNELVASSSAV